MADIQIHTAQNTVLMQNKASLGERMIATILDVLLMGAYVLTGTVVVAVFSLGNAFWLLFLLPVYFYSLVLELMFRGQTFGKKVMKLKVIHCEGLHVPVSAYILRWLLRLVDLWLFFGSIGTLVIILSQKGQRLGDMAANTIVVSVKNTPVLHDLSYPKGMEDELPVFAQANLLGDSDVELIRAVLAYGKENGYFGKPAAMIIQTASSMKKKLFIETDIKPVKFLEQLIRDYSLLHQ